MFGYELEDMIGDSVLDQIHPDDQGRAVEGWIAMLSTRRSQQTRLRRKRKDGSWVWVDTTLHNFLNQPERNHVLLELIDVSAEMAAQEALQEREELLRRLTDAMPDGLLQLDTERNVVYHNARLQEILGADALPSATERVDARRRQRTPGRRAAARQAAAADAHRGEHGGLQEAIADVLEDGADQDLEVDFSLPSGEPRCALLSIRSLLRHRRGQRRDRVRARRHRQRPRPPGARAARDVRRADPDVTTARRSSARCSASSSTRTRPARPSCTSISTTSSRSTTRTGTPQATNC